MAEKICPICNTATNEEASSCPKCGYSYNKEKKTSKSSPLASLAIFNKSNDNLKNNDLVLWSVLLVSLLLVLSFGGLVAFAPTSVNNFMSKIGVTTHFGEKKEEPIEIVYEEEIEKIEKVEEVEEVTEEIEEEPKESLEDTVEIEEEKEEEKVEETQEEEDTSTPVPEEPENDVLGTATVNVDKLLRRTTPIYDTTKTNVRDDPRHATRGATYDVYEITESSNITWYRIGDDVWIGNPFGKDYITYKEN